MRNANNTVLVHVDNVLEPIEVHIVDNRGAAERIVAKAVGPSLVGQAVRVDDIYILPVAVDNDLRMSASSLPAHRRFRSLGRSRQRKSKCNSIAAPSSTSSPPPGRTSAAFGSCAHLYPLRIERRTLRASWSS